MRIEVQNATELVGLPSNDDFFRWAMAALQYVKPDASSDTEMVVRIVDEAESAELNSDYRGKSGPTNVLSFEVDLPADVDVPLLGDLVICAPVVRREAGEQCKAVPSHWAHMVVHGVLHLCGYDHIEDDEAEVMEGFEREIMASLGYADPYKTL